MDAAHPTALPSSDAGRRRRLVIFVCTTILSLLTSMSKVLVPAAVFEPLQRDLGCSAAMLTTIGSAYMYSYSASQVALGLFADRLGGIRILLIGGTLFAFGSLCTPLCHSPYTLMLCRGMTGFGAGTVFVSVAKQMAELFPKRFGTVMGMVMFLGYFGPVMGGLPTVCLVEHFQWRPVLLVIGILPVVCMGFIWCLFKGQLGKIRQGSAWKGLVVIFTNRDGLLLFCASGCVFGVFYAVLTCIGQKSLEEGLGLPRFQASLIVTSLGFVVAFMNLLNPVVLNVFRKRRNLLMVVILLLSVVSMLLGSLVFVCHLGWPLLALAFFLAALAAGSFSLFTVLCREIYPKEYTGLSTALLNFAAFVFIALFGNVAGLVLKWQEHKAVNGLFPASVYALMFLCFAILALGGLLCCFFMRLPRQDEN